MKIPLTLFLFNLCILSSCSVKERMIKLQKEKPAPVAESVDESKITQPGDYTIFLNHQGKMRYYKIHIPKSYSPNQPTPLVLALHGGGGDMEIQATDKYYNQISKSEKEGYIVIFPNGYSMFKSGKLATWNAGRCCGDARDEKIDDVGFIKEIVMNVQKQANIDRKRIFASGMSNGGMMAYRLACELPDIFKAVAAVAGTDNTAVCTPKSPVSILHIHAQNDDHVIYKGGAGKTFRDPSKVTNFTSVPATIEKWKKLNGCVTPAKKTLAVKGAFCETYAECTNKTEVKLCVTDSGAHSWPGGSKPRGIGETPSTAISATDVIWDFFKTK